MLDGRSKALRFLEVSRQPWTMRIHQKYCNNVIGRSRFLAPISLQKWGSLLLSFRYRLQTPVLVSVLNRDLVESRTWSTRSRVNGDRGLPPLWHFLSPPTHHTSSHIVACISAGSKEWQVITFCPLPLFSSHVLPFPVCPSSSLCSCAFLLFGVYWLLIFPQMSCLSLLRFLRAFFYISSVCIRSSFCCITPPPLSRWTYGYIESSCPYQTCACMYHLQEALPSSRTGYPSLLSLVIYFVVEIVLLLPCTIVLGCHHLLSS
ncbi:hypothetical protein BDM02DRAFT_1128937 [Thelephora ganbajun]|uniref:Uncharacterized protein n=1 Tax=Thelephora ganbajun TaxID=370292 RepID=A0ACB6ZXA8_THEGA|nr:hypothetical protein BDM02DRAFT_1128937 [Thelephora ganbajun]